MDKGFSIKAFLPECGLFAIMAVVLFMNLGVFNIDPYSEFFHLESAKETLSQGRFWIPQLNGHDYLVRGPLWTWLTLLSFKLGGLQLSSARWLAACFSLSGLFLTYLFSLELTRNRFSALFSTSWLAVSWGFFHLGSLATADILTMNLYLAFLWQFLKWKDLATRRNSSVEAMNRLLLIMGGLLGTVVLCSGSLSALLLLLIVGLYLFLNQQTLLLTRLNFTSFLLPAILLPLPWLLGASLQPGAGWFLTNYLLVYPVQKVLGLGIWQHLHRDWLFYAKRMLIDLLPFTLLIPAAFLDPEAGSPNRGAHGSTPQPVWLLSWFLCGFVAYSVSAFQEPTLMLPFLPPLAIIAGSYLGQVVEASGNKSNAYYEKVLVAYIIAILIAAVIFTIVIFQVVPSTYVLGFWKLPGLAVLESINIKDKVFPLPEAFPLWKFWLIPGPFILLIGAFTLFFLQLSRKLTLTPLALCGSLLMFTLFLKVVYLPIMCRPVHQAVAQQLNHDLQPEDRVLLFSLQPSVKRVLFFIDQRFRPQTGFIHSGDAVAQRLELGHGRVFTVIREKSYFNDVDFTTRSQFRVNQYQWQWDLDSLREMGKIGLGRLPEFDRMRSEVLVLQSLPTDTLRVMKTEEQNQSQRKSL